MIETSSITQLITALRQASQAQSVTPETVGSILQKIVDALAKAATEDDVKALKDWNAALKAAAKVLTGLSQGTADRNHVYLRATTLDIINGISGSIDNIQIQQATTERAGAMRAQQVVDLNNARRDIAALKTSLNTAVSNSTASIDSVKSDLAKLKSAVGDTDTIVHLDPDTYTIPDRDMPDKWKGGAVAFDGFISVPTSNLQAASLASNADFRTYYNRTTNTFVFQDASALTLKYYNNVGHEVANLLGSFDLNGKKPHDYKLYIDRTTEKVYRFDGTTLVETARTLTSEQVAELFPAKGSIAHLKYKIAVEILDGELTVKGADKLIEEGYVPYLFRYCSKTNRNKNPLSAEDGVQGFRRKFKGWNVWRDWRSVGVNSDGSITLYSVDSLGERSNPQPFLPIRLFTVHLILGNGTEGSRVDIYGDSSAATIAEASRLILDEGYKFYCQVAWGNRSKCVGESSDNGRSRQMKINHQRFRWGIAFGKKNLSCHKRLTLADMVSNLAEFTIRSQNPSGFISLSREGIGWLLSGTDGNVFCLSY